MQIVPEEQPFTVSTLNLSRVDHRVNNAFVADENFMLAKLDWPKSQILSLITRY